MSELVEVVYIAADGSQWFEQIKFKTGMTISIAVKNTSFFNKYDELSNENYIAGIWSKREELSTLVQPGDRIEIYRELEINPKDRRKIKAKEQGFDLKNNRKKKD